jgi:hypothetical protein
VRLTWRKEPSEGGLRSVGQGPRGHVLSLDGERIGAVTAHRLGWAHEWRGWDWYCRVDGVRYAGKSDDPDAARDACDAAARKALGLPPKKPKVQK